MECLRCNTPTCYIGETSQPLNRRINQHLCKFSNKNNKSEVANHDIESHGTINRESWRVSILKEDVPKNLERKIWESKMIHALKPKINKRQGIMHLKNRLSRGVII